ncbi:DNA polymerase epsilon subunit 3-like [Oppia nitens]|uniref:DNA polymerase epsilon subunit 3-like n=1 Tax=Oppia nitens TaxID=1686743 RepID=UPI0023DADB13|nr:DNA polymerase epsilon subunit 3-like [Oppia nitens]
MKFKVCKQCVEDECHRSITEMAEKPDDFNMPVNNIAAIIKECLPNGVTVSQDVRSAVSRSASIFILYVTTCANSIANEHKRKTLTPNDIIEAINQIGFNEFTDELQELYKSLQKGKQNKDKDKSKNTNSDKVMEKMDELNDDKEEEDEEEEESDD